MGGGGGGEEIADSTGRIKSNHLRPVTAFSAHSPWEWDYFMSITKNCLNTSVSIFDQKQIKLLPRLSFNLIFLSNCFDILFFLS